MRGLIQSHLKGLVTDINFFEGSTNILSFTVAGRSKFTKADESEGYNYTYQRCKAFGLYANTLKDLIDIASPVEVFGQVRRRDYKNAQEEDRVDVSVTVNKALLLDGEFESFADSKGQLIMEDCINTTSIVGNLVRNVKYRKKTNGVSVANATLAVNSQYAERDYVTYINIKAFGNAADNLQASLKGQPIAATGRIAGEGYQTTEGEDRYHTFVAVHDASPLKILKQQDTQIGGDLDSAIDSDEVFPPDKDLVF